jgi:aryl carrier-like protein
VRVQQLISDDELLNPYEDLIMSGLDSLKIM